MNAPIILDHLVVLQLLDVEAVVYSDDEDGAEQHRGLVVLPVEGKPGHVPKPRKYRDVAAYDLDFDAFLVERALSSFTIFGKRHCLDSL